MIGHNYFALAIEGTTEQHRAILKRYPCHEDRPDDHPWIQLGRYRIINGVLLIEVEGWGSDVAWAKEVLSLAKGFGCKVFWLNIPDGRLNEESRQFTNDTEQKYFEKDGPNEWGVTFWGFSKEYRYDNN